MVDIKDAIEEISKGNLVILVDDEDRENEGDLVIAAEHATRKLLTLWQYMAGV